MPVGYVALLDVLGFSALIAGGEDNLRLRAYFETVQAALADPTSGVDYVVFSDTIVLTTKSDSPESLRSLIERCSALFGLLLQKDIAIRGAIACGLFFRGDSPGGVFVAGRPVLEAYDFETKQDWVGIMLTPSAVRQVPDLGARVELPTHASDQNTAKLVEKNIGWAAFLRPYGLIPFHSSGAFDVNQYDGFAIPPTDGKADLASLNESMTASLKALKWLKSLAPDPKAQEKYQRTLNWLANVASFWRDADYWKKRLAEQQGGSA